jgi:hypothetical protein
VCLPRVAEHAPTFFCTNLRRPGANRLRQQAYKSPETLEQWLPFQRLYLPISVSYAIRKAAAAGFLTYLLGNLGQEKPPSAAPKLHIYQ